MGQPFTSPICRRRRGLSELPHPLRRHEGRPSRTARRLFCDLSHARRGCREIADAKPARGRSAWSLVRAPGSGLGAPSSELRAVNALRRWRRRAKAGPALLTGPAFALRCLPHEGSRRLSRSASASPLRAARPPLGVAGAPRRRCSARACAGASSWSADRSAEPSDWTGRREP